MNLDTCLYVAVALFETPATEFGPPNHSALLGIHTDLGMIMKLVTAVQEDWIFQPGNYISVYRAKAQCSFNCYKLHRIGDELFWESSPIIFRTHRTGEGWTREWFSDEARAVAEPGILVA
ncbi:MAG: hypothetical protein V4481_04180 [Patescibacteria group bacterium]